MTLHSFVLPACGENPYLEQAIRSVVFQTVPSEILITTSTPNDYIKNLAEKYDLPLIINAHREGIRDDWNFAVNQAEGKYITIVHQDDIYRKDYTEKLLKAIDRCPDAVLYYTKYLPIIHGRPHANFNKAAKDFLQFPMKFRRCAESAACRRRTLAFGNSILCPSATYHRERIQGDIFTSDMKVALDWDTFERLVDIGTFCYIPEELVMYRVWDGSETSRQMDGRVRSREDRRMLERFWPEWFVNLYFPLFRLCYREYEK